MSTTTVFILVLAVVALAGLGGVLLAAPRIPARLAIGVTFALIVGSALFIDQLSRR